MDNISQQKNFETINSIIELLHRSNKEISWLKILTEFLCKNTNSSSYIGYHTVNIFGREFNILAFIFDDILFFSIYNCSLDTIFLSNNYSWTNKKLLIHDMNSFHSLLFDSNIVNKYSNDKTTTQNFIIHIVMNKIS